MPDAWLDGVDPSWSPALEIVQDSLDQIAALMTAERRGNKTLAPADELIFRALRTPLNDVRVVIVGQDPYPTPGHAVGLAFGTHPDVRPLPRSLANIYAELEGDLGIAPAEHGDLSRWAEQGVLLLNSSLTVTEGEAGSHRSWPWKDVTGEILGALAERGGPLVAILWGKEAQWAAPILAGVDIIESAHPSPLSARRGFFGSRPFSRANASLIAQGAPPIDWHR